MTVAQIYKSAAAAYGRPFVDDQCNAWSRSLKDFTAAEVQGAVDEWQRNTTPDYDGRTLGGKMPQPADLRAICQRQRESETRRQSGDFVCCSACEDGWLRVFAGRTVKGNVIDPKAGAVKMCQCRVDYLCQFFSCGSAEIPERLRKHREERRKRKPA
jgi:hypothetical protein